MNNGNNLNTNHENVDQNPVSVQQLGRAASSWCWIFTVTPVHKPEEMRTVVVACPAILGTAPSEIRKAFNRLWAALVAGTRLLGNPNQLEDACKIHLDAFLAATRNREPVPVLAGVFNGDWGLVVSTESPDLLNRSTQGWAPKPLDHHVCDHGVLYTRFLNTRSPVMVLFPKLARDAARSIGERFSDGAGPSALHSECALDPRELMQDGRDRILLTYQRRRPDAMSPEKTTTQPTPEGVALSVDPNNVPEQSSPVALRAGHDVESTLGRILESVESLGSKIDGQLRGLIDQHGKYQSELIDGLPKSHFRQLGQLLGMIEEAIEENRDCDVLIALRDHLRAVLERSDVHPLHQPGEFDPIVHELLNPGVIARGNYELRSRRSGLRRNGLVILKERVIAQPLRPRECSSI